MLATAGSAEKVAACREFGAAEAWNYREQDFAEEVKRLTDGKGIDAILDMVGGSYFPRNLRCLGRTGGW